MFVDEQFPDEILCELRGLREELLVEDVVTGDDVGVRLLLGFAKEGRRSGQTEKKIKFISKINFHKILVKLRAFIFAKFEEKM